MTVVLFVGCTGAALAQPLYLGDKEVDTADREALVAVVEHCEGLYEGSAQAQTEAELPSASLPADGQDLPLEDPNDNSFAGAISVDALVSSDDGAEAAGEGAGTGVPASDEEGQEGSGPTLHEITLEMCKAAGIIP